MGFWGAVLLIGVPLYFGWIDLGGTKVEEADKATVAESTSCDGYKLIRRFEADGVIDDFEAVKPAANWDCEYIVNDGVGDIRFNREAGGIGVEFIAGGSTSTNEANNLELAIQSELDKLGFDEQ